MDDPVVDPLRGREPAAVICPSCSQINELHPWAQGIECVRCRAKHAFLVCGSCKSTSLVQESWLHKGSWWFKCWNCGRKNTFGGLRSTRLVLGSAEDVSRLLGTSGLRADTLEIASLSGCQVVGGYNVPYPTGTTVSLVTTSTEVRLCPRQHGATRSVARLEELQGLEFGGPGLQVSGGGFIGGGFGFRGAAEGILAADILNSLTTKTTINSLIRVVLSGSEVWLHTSRMTSNQLTMHFSAVLGRVASRQWTHSLPSAAPPQNEASGDPVDRLARLAELRAAGALSEAEFVAAKKTILGLGS